MIILRRKQFGLLGSFTGMSNLAKAVGKSGKGLGALGRTKQAGIGLGKMAGIGLGTAAVGAGIAGSSATNALTGNMGGSNSSY